jgi:hypothetical protein
MTPEELEVREHIERSLCQGALNALDTAAMRQGYHKDFAIFGVRGEELTRLPLEEWIAVVESYRDDPTSRANGLRTMDHAFDYVDVTGDAAAAKLRFFRQGTPMFTDYLTLLRFGGEWKIVAKASQNHVPDPWS